MMLRTTAVAVHVALGMALGSAQAVAQATRGPAVDPAAASSGDLPTVEELAVWAGPDGEPARVREGILDRIEARGATGEQTVLWLRLLRVLDEVEPTVAAAAVRAVGLGVERDGGAGSDLLMESLEEASATARAPLLSLAAQLADQEDERRGAEIRARLLEEYPDADEAAEATFLRARWLLGSGDLREEGMRLLEAFIVEAPGHPLAPEARRLYEANGGRS